MKIRPATMADMDSICRLYDTLFREMADLQRDYFQMTSQNRDFLSSVIEGEAGDVLLAEEEDSLIGFALVQESSTPPFGCLIPHRYAYLMDACVAEEQRSRGIGRLLIEAVKTWSEERNLDYVELNVLSNNTRAIALYEREGFAEEMRTMRCKLKKDG
ncbi:putative acetyltransferase [uncultured Eubacterium sp.]|nr:putative acetyltransferase [uncultured Eubacterium sp.]